MATTRWAVALALALGCLAGLRAQEATKPLLGDLNDGSRARPVHVIPLRDVDGEIIRPGDRQLLPFSPSRTCGADCHDVQKIARGWHFNAAMAGHDSGRPGQPWILVDRETATQVPFSSRGWPGSFRPEQLGISSWRFATLFGGRTAGGIPEELTADRQARWGVSGDLEVNCLACHDASAVYDQAEYARQVGFENFRWAAAGASGIGQITGVAREMPDTFDYLLPSLEDALLVKKPSVTYAPERFLPGAKVAFDIVRRVPARRCYFCHSNADRRQTGVVRWNADEDVHLARGMTCVDCHRNGLDHLMTRGYEGEPAVRNNPDAATLSCRGCHYGTGPGRGVAQGRLGAPYPKHAGIPAAHFTRLTCTACHSGPWPEASARRFLTSQAHALGARNVNKSADVLPHLYAPVFSEQADGRIAPHRLLWPAFWGRLQHGAVQPIAPEQVKTAWRKARLNLKISSDGSWPELNDDQVVRGLRLLAGDPRGQGTPVYVAGGKVHRVDGAGRLAAADDPSAQPYLWPLAHDVRPASQSLGVRGCEDCHATDGPLSFGTVPVDSPLAAERGGAWKMGRFQKQVDPAYAADFARSFRYRPWLKAVELISAAVLALLLLAYATRGLARLSAAAGGDKRADGGERPF